MLGSFHFTSEKWKSFSTNFRWLCQSLLCLILFSLESAAVWLCQPSYSTNINTHVQSQMLWCVPPSLYWTLFVQSPRLCSSPLLPRNMKMVDIVAQKMPSENDVHVARSFLTKILRSSMRYGSTVTDSNSSHFIQSGVFCILVFPCSHSSVVWWCNFLHPSHPCSQVSSPVLRITPM